MLTKWITPSELAAASFSARNDKPESKIEDDKTVVIEKTPNIKEHIVDDFPPVEERKADENKSNSGLDLGALLGVLGSLNGGQDTSGLGSILGLIRGEKPDMMALMPLLASMMARKPEKTEQKAHHNDAKDMHGNTKIDLQNFAVE